MLRNTIITGFVLMLVLLSSGCATNPATGKSQLSLFAVSTEKEVDLGKKSFPVILQKMGGAYPDEQLQAYIQKVGERLAAASHRRDITYTFRVVNDSTPNAFALPGGYIAITRGLLVNLQTEDQMAAVLGHEIGHVDARHAVQGMQRSTLLDVGIAVLAGATGTSQYGSLIQSSGEVAATLIDRSYSRGQEEESDLLGIDYMVGTHYDPQGAVELQRIFYQQIENGKNPEWLEGLFRSHPFSKSRMEKNREYIATRYASVAKPAGRPDNTFQQVTAGLQQTRKAYELYDQARQAEKEGATDKAIALYLKAAELGPEEALILTGLGMAYLRQDDLVTARQHLQRAVRIDGNYFYSRLGLSYISMNQGEFNKTITHATRSFELLPTVEAVYFMARGNDGAGNVDKALEYYRVVEKNDPQGKMGQQAAARIAALGGTK